MNYLSSGQVAQLLGVATHRLDYLTRDRQVRPRKGPTGAFVWRYQEVVKAAELLEVRPPTREGFRETALQHGPSVREEAQR